MCAVHNIGRVSLTWKRFLLIFKIIIDNIIRQYFNIMYYRRRHKNVKRCIHNKCCLITDRGPQWLGTKVAVSSSGCLQINVSCSNRVGSFVVSLPVRRLSVFFSVRLYSVFTHGFFLHLLATTDGTIIYKLASWSSGYRTSAGRLVGLGACGVSSFIPVARYTRVGELVLRLKPHSTLAWYATPL